MNIMCVICSDLLTPSNDVCVHAVSTPCGHIFHNTCLEQWLEREQTCPHCRGTTTSQTIRKIYLNFSNDDSILEATASLQHEIHEMTSKLQLKDANLDKLTNMNEVLKTQITSLKYTMGSKCSMINTLKDRIKQQCLDADDYRKENEILKSNFEHLKKKLSVVSEKSKEINEKYKDKLHKYMHVTKENKFLSQKCAKNKKLEDELILCKRKMISLETRLNYIQRFNQPSQETAGSSHTSFGFRGHAKYDLFFLLQPVLYFCLRKVIAPHFCVF